MTPQRFNELAAAYGGDITHWPLHEQARAAALAASGSPEVTSMLHEATALDGWLDAHAVQAPAAALIDRIVNSAPGAGAANPSLRGEAPRVSTPSRTFKWRWLWPGAGLAGASLAGALAGAFAVSVALRASAPGATSDWPERGTSFTELSADWSEE